jgi:chromosome segregation ATPase
MLARQAQLHKQHQRERNKYQQEIHALKMQGNMLQSESDNCRYRLSQVEEQLTMIEGDGENQIEKYMEELEDETMQRVRQIE